MPKSHEQDTDIQLVRRAQKGNQSAFGLLVGRYQQRVIYQALRWSKNHADAEDIAQESFVRAWRGLKNFRGESSFYTWLFRIVANTAHSQVSMRSQSTTTTMSEEGWEAIEAQGKLMDIDSPESLVERDELAQVVRQTIQAMHEEQREALMLREQGGMSYEQIAEVMDTPLGTVRSRIFRARSELTEKLQQWRDTGNLNLKQDVAPSEASSKIIQNNAPTASQEKQIP